MCRATLVGDRVVVLGGNNTKLHWALKEVCCIPVLDRLVNSSAVPLCAVQIFDQLNICSCLSRLELVQSHSILV